RLLARPEIEDNSVSALMVSLVDPDSADAATALGVGGRGDFLVGGRSDARAPGPAALHAGRGARDEAAATGRSAALRVLAGARRPRPRSGSGGVGTSWSAVGAMPARQVRWRCTPRWSRWTRLRTRAARRRCGCSTGIGRRG